MSVKEEVMRIQKKLTKMTQPDGTVRFSYLARKMPTVKHVYLYCEQRVNFVVASNDFESSKMEKNAVVFDTFGFWFVVVLIWT